jgi:murein DD-endopeptidase MepM/ murein hydrolase activator NlpD
MHIALNRNAHIKSKYSKRLARSFSVALLFLLFISNVRSSSAQPGMITFVHKERALKPGEVIVLKARSSRQLKTLRIEAFDREFTAYNEGAGRTWSGLIGIDLETKPGRYSVKLTGADADGKSVTSRGILWIYAKSFPTRRLVVDEKYVTPSKEALVRIEDENKRVQSIFASVTPEKLWNGPFRAPVPGEVISVFGKRNYYNGQPRNPHTGVDFRGDTGTPIRSPNSGRVVLAADLYYSGNTVIIDHGLGLYSYLGHMSKSAVKEGDRVETGDIIGRVGATGRVTGPHLHWTVRLSTARVDPLSLIKILSGP